MQRLFVGALLAAVVLSLAACSSGGSGYTPTHKPPVERTSTPKALVTVPDIVGMEVAIAQDALEDLGLEMSADVGELPAAAIIDEQDPVAGTEVDDGEWVHVTVTAPTPTPTPEPRLAADDPARVGLEANFGLIFTDESFAKMRDQYCTMTDKMLLATGEYAAENIRDVTPAKFVLWIAEKCGR